MASGTRPPWSKGNRASRPARRQREGTAGLWGESTWGKLICAKDKVDPKRRDRAQTACATGGSTLFSLLLFILFYPLTQSQQPNYDNAVGFKREQEVCRLPVRRLPVWIQVWPGEQVAQEEQVIARPAEESPRCCWEVGCRDREAKAGGHYKRRGRTSRASSNRASGCLPKINGSRISERQEPSRVHSSISDSSQDGDAAQRSNNGGRGGEGSIHHTHICHSALKKTETLICNSMDEP